MIKEFLRDWLSTSSEKELKRKIRKLKNECRVLQEISDANVEMARQTQNYCVKLEKKIKGTNRCR